MNKVENIELDEDGISLADIVEFVQESWKTVALWSAIGLIGGTGYAFLATPKYQATANIQTAKVANTDVEAPALLADKLKLPSYYTKETIDACGIGDVAEPGLALANALKPALSKGTSLVSISYKAESQDAALSCISAVVQSVRQNQELITKPLIDAKMAELSSLEQKAAAAQQLEKMALNKSGANDFNDSKFLASSLLLSASKDLAKQIGDLKPQLLAPQTKPTELAAPSYASPKPVEPKKLIAMVGGLFGGAVLSVVYLLGRKQLGKISKT